MKVKKKAGYLKVTVSEGPNIRAGLDNGANVSIAREPADVTTNKVPLAWGGDSSCKEIFMIFLQFTKCLLKLSIRYSNIL